MIRSFRDKRTAAVFMGEKPRTLPGDILSVARRKLRMLDAARDLDDLRSPPGNQLKRLSRDRAGQFSIRINDQWRICFAWQNGAFEQVEIVDYH